MTSVDTFLKNLSDSGLLSSEEVQAAAAQLPPSQRQDCRALAETLVQQRKLTKYQASMVIQGKTRGLLLDNYVILEKLGQGGMGKVFKARPKRAAGQLVAIKVLPPSATSKPNAVARFKREAKAASQLRHPNIVAALGAGEDQGVHFLVMEYVEGVDLLQQVKQHGPLPLPHAVRCILQAARGLAHAHGAGVVHRDIKPANLLVNKAGVVKILDMGLARIDDGDGGEQPATQLTQDGALLGTIDYMAPEQAINSKNVDQRADLYSLGCTFYYLLTGQPMYTGDTPLQRLLAHREQPIPELPGGDAALQAIFRRMVAKKPEDRYPSMVALLTDLEKQLPRLGGGSAVRLPSLPLPRLPRSALRWAVLGAGGLVGLLVLVLVLSSLGGGPPTSQARKAATPSVATPPAQVVEEPPAVVDLLSLVDLGQDATRGQWSFRDGSLRVEGSNCLLELPYRPPEEYDFGIEFTRHGGGSVQQLLTRGGRNLMFTMGFRDLVGFERINGRNLRNAPAGASSAVPIEPHRRHTALVQVRRDGFKAHIDGQLVCEARVDDTQISLFPSQEPRDPRLLGLAAWDINRGVSFHKAEVVEVSGPGSFTRPGDPAAQAAARLQKKGKGPTTPPPTTSSVEDPARWQRAINLMPLIDLDQDVLAGRWHRDADGISSEAMPVPKLTLPYLPPEEYDFRIDFVRLNGGNGVMQMLAKSGQSFSWEMGIYNNRFMAFAAINGRGANQSEFSIHQGIANGQRYSSIVQVRNQGLKAYVNGKLVCDLPTNYQNLGLASYWNWPPEIRTLGIGSFQSAARYYRIEVLEVTGRGVFTRPNDPAAREAEKQRGE